jgi:hypothetical protein
MTMAWCIDDSVERRPEVEQQGEAPPTGGAGAWRDNLDDRAQHQEKLATHGGR